jgi:hypothetical protein
MRDQPSQHAGAEDPRLERAIVLQVLCDGHEPRWSRTELEAKIADGQSLDISVALASLEADRLVCVSGESVWASRALRRLDHLGLIAT